MYATRSNNHISNKGHVDTIIEKHPEFFEPISARYPKFDVMMARLLVNSFGFAVGKIDASVKLVDFKDHHSETVAKSVATLLRKRKTVEVALDAWRKQFTQMNIMYDEVEGFALFMDFIASSLLRNSMYGTVYRVSIGAVSSTVDAATDIYVIFTYYETDALVGRANTLLAMICMNMFFQLIAVRHQHKKKSTAVKSKELLITLLFLRPAVDAF